MVERQDTLVNISDGEENDFASSLVPDFDFDSDLKQTVDEADGTKINPVHVKPAITPLDLELLGEESGDEGAFNDIISKKRKTSSGGFQSMGLSSFLLKAIQRKGFRIPTPIQRKCIPLIVDGFDVVGMARTGSGKTAAFVIPLIEKLKTHSARVGARGIILSPNRELAFQTSKVISELSKGTDLRNCAIVGGESLEEQFNLLAGNPDIIIATPGRLLHLVIESELDLKTVEYVVFDEADRLFELGFDVQLKELLSRLPQSRQTLLFSATLPKTLVEFAKAGLQDPTLVRLDADTKMSQDLELAFFNVKQNYKEACLLYLLREVIKCPLAHQVDRPIVIKAKESHKEKKARVQPTPLYTNQTIIFVATKHHVEYISSVLKHAGYDVGSLYGSMDQVARQSQIRRFRDQQVPLFVVTDVAARGIDIPILENVINYDFVDQSKVFIHRVGRVARAGRRGWAYSFVTTDDLAYFYDLQLFLGRSLFTPDQVTPENRAGLDYTKDLVIGLLATDNELGSDLEWLHVQLDKGFELAAQQKVALNGLKMFKKSRQAVLAAGESHQRAKELLRSGKLEHIHPLLANRIDQVEAERNEIIRGISCFKPTETVFEIGGRGVKKASLGALIMKQRRTTLDSAILDYRSQKTPAKPAPAQFNRSNPDGEMDDSELEATFKPAPSAKAKRTTKRDEENYISYFQKDAHTEKGYSVQGGSFVQQAQNATLNLTNDDRVVGASGSKSQLRWDKKKKKFIRGDGAGSDNKKILKTEAGNRLPASYKQGLLTAWQKKRGAQLPRAGETELGDSRQKLQSAKTKRKFRYGPEDGLSGPQSKKVKSELKAAVEIRKEREAKERRRAKTGRHAKGKANPSKKSQARNPKAPAKALGKKLR
ncbi:ATP-dependent RNA helicase dbp10 [Massospora cicadina]|nr:ATP-dependent RNA helicase dbp10 [Massospora cicadina]